MLMNFHSFCFVNTFFLLLLFPSKKPIIPEVYLEPSETSTMKLFFANIVTIF